MKIVVCMKETPATEVPKTLGADMRLTRNPADTIINPFDEYTIEEGLRQQEKLGSEVVILTMSPGTTSDVMRKALAMGADSGIFITDPALAGSDAVATGRVLAAALQKIGYDLALFGQSSADAYGGIVPSVVAEVLGVPLLSFANKLEIEGNTVTIERQAEVGYVKAQGTLPALVSVTKAINLPRYPSMKGIMGAKKKPVETLSLADLGVDASGVGANAARERVTGASPVSTQRRHEIITGNDGAAQRILDFLIEQKII
ncbi:MAG TPA: electron transfer flavoprotein subunit beta/FixA family protein [Ktedonobacterales bacterium]|nr:electron transfer flavoprotein subunit beta/FixA family protein [Ktedonobacterales bacterium]